MTKQKDHKSLIVDNLKKFTKQQTEDRNTLLQKKKMIEKLSGNFITKYYNDSLDNLLDELIHCVKNVKKELEINLYPTDAKKKKHIYSLFLRINFIDIILKCKHYEIKGKDKILVKKMMKELRDFFNVFENLNKDLYSTSKITMKNNSSEFSLQLHKEKPKKSG